MSKPDEKGPAIPGLGRPASPPERWIWDVIGSHYHRDPALGPRLHVEIASGRCGQCGRQSADHGHRVYRFFAEPTGVCPPLPFPPTRPFCDPWHFEAYVAGHGTAAYSEAELEGMRAELRALSADWAARRNRG